MTGDNVFTNDWEIADLWAVVDNNPSILIFRIKDQACNFVVHVCSTKGDTKGEFGDGKAVHVVGRSGLM